MTLPKVLCVCKMGHCRSVALSRALHEQGYEAVAIGWGTSGTALRLLCDWADVIAVMEARFIKFVPTDFKQKVVDFDIGRDRWKNPFHKELTGIVATMLKERQAKGLM